jgi:hypothetical protein
VVVRVLGNLPRVQANSDAVAPRNLAGILLTLVVIASLASFVLIQAARERGEVLDLVHVKPRTIPYSRSGERVRIEWRQRRASDDAVVRMIDSAERPVRTLLGGGALAGGDTEQVFHWNGRIDSGGFAEPGRYRVQILLRDQDRDIIPEQSLITVEGAGEQDLERDEG